MRPQLHKSRSLLGLRSRLTTLFRRRKPQQEHPSAADYSDSDDSLSSGSAITTPSVSSSTAAPPDGTECYACTQPGAPAFHSAACRDRNRFPEWSAGVGSSLIPIHPASRPTSAVRLLLPHAGRPSGPFGRVLDPRSKRVQQWNRAFLLARALSLAIDPLFFYSLSVVGRKGEPTMPPCLYMDGALAAAVTALRTLTDGVHIVHIWTQLRLAYVSRESLVVGCGKLVWDPRNVAWHYLGSFWRFWFDVFVVLPIPQMAFWFVVPRLIREEKVQVITTVLLLIFVFHFLPKVYHSICTMRRMQKVTGFIFGTIWWGFFLNVIAYFIASHVAGGCWYLLAIQRVESCVRQMCQKSATCISISFSCTDEVCYRGPLSSGNTACGGVNLTHAAKTGGHGLSQCLNRDGPFRYGIYKWALAVVSSNSLAVKVLYPIFWGLMSLSTFGNDLEPTSHWLEVIFSITVVLSGLMLFTLLIGNIQVLLHSIMARKRTMQLRWRDMEWWMKRRQLPPRLKHRVRQYERQRWAALRGEEEMEVISDLPEGLRRDIKRHLCLNLIKQVPLFQSLDDLILDNICDKVKPLVFSKGEKIIREGDPVQRMIFIVRGRIESTQRLSRGVVATCALGPGSFFGDELLSWCLRRPPATISPDRLPPASCSFSCVDPAEAFGLDADDLRFIADHFRYKFANERLKRTARYYSSNWRTWAAVTVQAAWRRGRARAVGGDAARVEGRLGDPDDAERRLRRYAAVFMSLKPQDHLE